MLRAEHRAAQEKRPKENLKVKARQLAQIQAHKRAADRAIRAKRRQVVGTIADHAGLLAWDDATLTQLFPLLATLQDVPDPVAVLESLLASPGSGDAGVGNGFAHALHGVAPLVPES